MDPTTEALPARHLCDVDIVLEDGHPLVFGRSPWRNRRFSAIVGGSFAGPQLSGEVLSGGGDWSEGGEDGSGDALTLIDVRSTWRTSDGALIHVTYSGRLVIPTDALADFRDPARVEALAADRYHFRIQPLFEASDPRYAWLNRQVAVGFGQRTAAGVRYRIFAVL